MATTSRGIISGAPNGSSTVSVRSDHQELSDQQLFSESMPADLNPEQPIASGIKSSRQSRTLLAALRRPVLATLAGTTLLFSAKLGSATEVDRPSVEDQSELREGQAQLGKFSALLAEGDEQQRSEVLDKLIRAFSGASVLRTEAIRIVTEHVTGQIDTPQDAAASRQAVTEGGERVATDLNRAANLLGNSLAAEGKAEFQAHERRATERLTQGIETVLNAISEAEAWLPTRYQRSPDLKEASVLTLLADAEQKLGVHFAIGDLQLAQRLADTPSNFAADNVTLWELVEQVCETMDCQLEGDRKEPWQLSLGHTARNKDVVLNGVLRAEALGSASHVREFRGSERKQVATNQYLGLDFQMDVEPHTRLVGYKEGTAELVEAVTNSGEKLQVVQRRGERASWKYDGKFSWRTSLQLSVPRDPKSTEIAKLTIKVPIRVAHDPKDLRFDVDNFVPQQTKRFRVQHAARKRAAGALDFNQHIDIEIVPRQAMSKALLLRHLGYSKSGRVSANGRFHGIPLGSSPYQVRDGVYRANWTVIQGQGKPASDLTLRIYDQVSERDVEITFTKLGITMSAQR